jgi:hypothetical protein
LPHRQEPLNSFFRAALAGSILAFAVLMGSFFV